MADSSRQGVSLIEGDSRYVVGEEFPQNECRVAVERCVCVTNVELFACVGHVKARVS